MKREITIKAVVDVKDEPLGYARKPSASDTADYLTRALNLAIDNRHRQFDGIEITSVVVDDEATLIVNDERTESVADVTLDDAINVVATAFLKTLTGRTQ